MKVKKCVSEKHSLSLIGPHPHVFTFSQSQIEGSSDVNRRTSEPASLNIGTPFQMTLKAVGNPAGRLRQKNCPAAYFRTPLCVQHSTQHLCTENEEPSPHIHRYQTQHFTLRASFAAKRVVGKGCCGSEIPPSVFFYHLEGVSGL